MPCHTKLISKQKLLLNGTVWASFSLSTTFQQQINESFLFANGQTKTVDHWCRNRLLCANCAATTHSPRVLKSILFKKIFSLLFIGSLEQGGFGDRDAMTFNSAWRRAKKRSRMPSMFFLSLSIICSKSWRILKIGFVGSQLWKQLFFC